jgi:hypothetical protein
VGLRNAATTRRGTIAGGARATARFTRVRLARLFTPWGRGYRRLAESHAATVGGDTAFAVALAGTLFFTVPSTEARGNVALYLLLTLAPFAVVGPLLGRVFERSPGAYRSGLVLSSLLRAVVAFITIPVVDSILLFPMAFTLLILSRFYGISRSSVLPVVVRDAAELIDANARLARVGVLAGAVVVPIAGVLVAVLGAWPGLAMAMVLYLVSAITAAQLPPMPKDVRRSGDRPRGAARPRLPRRVRLARFATAGVRLLNGYLLLLVAFAFRDSDAAVLSLTALIAAAGVGFYIAAVAAPVVGSFIREEPMVVTALAIEAMAAFITAQVFSLWAAMILVAAAGFAWGTAKFGFDGMLQGAVPAASRGWAFTISETVFQIAWVIGALIPVLPFWPTELGLASAGVLALIIQVVYVTLVLLPEAVRSSREGEKVQPGDDDERGVLDLL